MIKFPLPIIKRAIWYTSHSATLFKGRYVPYEITTGELQDLVIEWRLGEKKFCICLGEIFGECYRLIGPDRDDLFSKSDDDPDDPDRFLKAIDWFLN